MNKQKLLSRLRSFGRLRPWYFLILFVITGLICVNALRTNNLTMAQLRDNVYTADKNNADVAGALETLQAYVTTHMNTDLSGGPNAVYPPIQLKYTYQRLQDAQQQAILKSLQANGQLYTAAQAYCQQQDPTDFSGHNRVPCIEQYVQSHGSNVNLTSKTIPPYLYEFDFVSPSWSPDLAGWSMLLSGLFLLLFVISWLVERFMRPFAG